MPGRIRDVRDRLPQEQIIILEVIAEHLGVKVSDVFRFAVLKYIQNEYPMLYHRYIAERKPDKNNGPA